MRKVLGVFFIILSIIGGLLPILPGFIFFFIGIALISPTWEEKLKKVYSDYGEHQDPKKSVREIYSLFLASVP